MAGRRRRRRVRGGPVAAHKWREYARYLARIIIEADDKLSLDELRETAAGLVEVDDPARGHAAAEILAALEAADAGRPYAPYSDLVVGRAA